MTDLSTTMKILLDQNSVGDILYALKQACQAKFVEYGGHDDIGDPDDDRLDWIGAQTSLDEAMKDLAKYVHRVSRGSIYYLGQNGRPKAGW